MSTSQGQAFEALRKDLEQKVTAKEQEVVELKKRLEAVEDEVERAVQALEAHENTMASLGLLDGRRKKHSQKKVTTAPKKRGPKATKPKVAKTAAKATGSKAKSHTNAAEGRRAVARGDRPPMKEAMITVMGGPGSKPMDAASIVAGLNQKNWMPTSKDPQQYISYMLSSNKEAFERVERGLYVVRQGATSKEPRKMLLKNTDATPPTPPPSKEEVTTELENLGIDEKGNVAANPFAT